MGCIYQYTTKVCYTCNVEKNVSEFNTRTIKGGYTYRSNCKDCEKQYHKNINHKKKQLPMYIEQNPTRTKVCSVCLEVKSIVDFPLADNRKGSYYSHCKKCDSAKNKLYNETKRKPARTTEWYAYVERKVCRCCGVEKQSSEFGNVASSKDGKRSQCKVCASAEKKIYKANNKEKIRESSKLYREANLEVLKEREKQYRDSPEGQAYQKQYRKKNSEKLSTYQKEYEKTNKEVIRKGQRRRDNERRKNDSDYLIKAIVKTNLQYAFRNQSVNGKQKKTKEYGIDIKAIVEHIGYRPSDDYELDHIIPVAIFDFDNNDHVRISHLPENLRWLPAKENNLKKDKILWDLISTEPVLLEIAKILQINETHNGMCGKKIKESRKNKI